MFIEDDEVGKYKKKKSRKSNAFKKAFHKHIYEDCLLIKNNEIPRKASYCTICGKIYNISFYETIKDGQFYRQLTAEEIINKYNKLNLPRFNIENIDLLDLKYVPIEGQN